MIDAETDPGTTDVESDADRDGSEKGLEADYGDATPEDVALALLRYRRGRETGSTR